MALHNLKIVVVDGGRAGSYRANRNSKDNENAKKNYKDSKLYKILNARETITKKVQSGMSASSVFAMNMGLHVASQLVHQTANYYISDIGRKNGDSNYQSMINRQMEIVGDCAGFFGSTLAGAKLGSMVGPGGAVLGAVLGAVSSVASLGFKYSERERDYEHERFKQNTSQSVMLARANYSIYTGRRI